MLEHAMMEFGRRLGLGGLALAPGRPLTLKLEGLGSLVLELKDAPPAEVLMTLAAPLAPYDHSIMRRALALCSFEYDRPFSLAVGCQADNMLLMTRLAADGCRGDELAGAAEMLIGNLRALMRTVG